MKVYKHTLKKPKFHNLTRKQTEAIALLDDNPEIIIKPADKGGCIVIQNTTDYIAECLRQLSDTTFYEPQTIDLTPTHNQLVSEKVESLCNKDAISAEVADYLVFSRPCTACFYTLPKIHKPTRPPPGRPIVSANECPTERISGFVDHFLRPFVPLIKSYVKDTTHFINQIENIPPLPRGALLVTLDVTSLYTNIPNQDALRVAKQTLDTHWQDPHTHLTNSDLKDLLELVLTCNNFEFNNSHYKQIQGVAMGTRVAPTIANLVMADFEERFVYTYALQPLVWLRYIDDNFMVWTHGQEELDIFLAHLNACHPTIKFTHEASQTEAVFLDTRVCLDQDRTLYTTLYCRPTDTHCYLHFSSCHPKHQKTGGPRSQFLRLRRICKKPTDYLTHAYNLVHFYQLRDYPIDPLIASLKEVEKMDRSQLLAPRPPKEPQENNNLFCLTTYHPNNPPLRNILEETRDVLGSDPRLSCITSKNFVFGHRRLPNVKDRLVKSRLRYPPPPPAPPKPPGWVNPDKVCSKTNCQICAILDTSGSLTSTSTGRNYAVPQRITCQFNNLIYVITCTRCHMQYVGQTKQKLGDRIRQHLLDIRHCQDWLSAPPSAHAKGPTNVGLHFSQRGHQITDVTVQIIEMIKHNPDSARAKEIRDLRENYWMHCLKSLVPLGINAMDGTNHTRTRPNRIVGRTH